jgi:hypothetical protein
MRNGAPTKRRMGDKANCYEVAKQNSPGLKPWAILLSHFLAIAVSPVRPFALSQLGRCRCGLFAGELRQEFFVIQRMREHRKVVFYRVLVRFFANGGCAIF